MIHTPFTETFGIEHPVALGGMGSIYSPPLVAAVSHAGGLGALGCHGLTPDQIRAAVAVIRARTDKPFALNFLLFQATEEPFAAALACKPKAMAFAWPRGDQDLRPWFDRAHEAGAKITFMAGDVATARRGAAAGADVIVAQGTEGGVLLGTRFLASDESPLHPNFKQAIVASDGHDTVLSEIPDLAAGIVWPGAMSRSKRNGFIERWMGREWAIRQQQRSVLAAVQSARQAGDTENAPLSFGQDAGLIHEILPAAEIVRRIVEEAELILGSKLPRLVKQPALSV
jgi:NAD(P)H-dependent flavin oxidoreductase YrpB (nitropropane dioxygenase family)